MFPIDFLVNKDIVSEINKFSQGKKPKSPELITNHVTGKFFTIVDGDDYWEGDYYRVEKMIAALMNDQDASFSFSDVKKFNNGNNDKFSEHLSARIGTGKRGGAFTNTEH